jgi:hypothetical protein
MAVALGKARVLVKPTPVVQGKVTAQAQAMPLALGEVRVMLVVMLTSPLP